MNKDSPFYRFGPESPGWLARKEMLGEHIAPPDVNRVLVTNADAVNDPVVQPFLARLAAGELKAKRGRSRRRSFGWMAKMMVARLTY